MRTFPCSRSVLMLVLVLGLQGCGGGLPGGLEGARELAGLGRRDQAEKAYLYLIDDSDNQQEIITARIELGCLLADSERAAEAKPYLLPYSSDLKAARCLGQAYRLSRDFFAAFEVLGQVCKNRASTGLDCRQAVQVGLAADMVGEAADLAQYAADRFPRDPNALLAQAEVLALGGEVELCLAVLDRLTGLAPENMEAWFMMGNVLWSEGDFEAAADCYGRAAQIQPHVPDVWRNLGVVQLQAGRYAQAAEALETALSLAPDDVQILVNLGVAYAGLGRLNDSRAVFEQAVILKPNDPVLRNNLADVLLRLGEVKAAREHIDVLVRVDPDRRNALRLQRDLVALEVVLDEVCERRKGVITRVEEAFAERGWPREAAAESLRRMLADPFFEGLIDRAGDACPARP